MMSFRSVSNIVPRSGNSIVGNDLRAINFAKPVEITGESFQIEDMTVGEDGLGGGCLFQTQTLDLRARNHETTVERRVDPHL